MVVGYGSAYRPSKRCFHGHRRVPTGSQQFVHSEKGAHGCVNLRPRDEPGRRPVHGIRPVLAGGGSASPLVGQEFPIEGDDDSIALWVFVFREVH
jgi:hypothetical protein